MRAAILFWIAFLVAVISGHRSWSDKPNVILIMTDDQGYGDMSLLSEAINDPQSGGPNRSLEVIKDPAFDTSTLDREDLHLLGSDQEAFVRDWARRVAKEKRLAAVLSQSPFVNIGNYDVRYGDMDANGWPQSAR